MLRIKVTDKEHQIAVPQGCAYGLVNGLKGMYAYAELGQEVDRAPKDGEDVREDRREFIHCEVFFALTQEQLINGEFEGQTYRGKGQIFK